MFMNVYGDETASCSYVFKRQGRLSDGQVDMHNYSKSSEQLTIKGDNNIKKIQDLMCSDHCLMIRMMTAMWSMSKE